jgi:malonyl-CoA/methylmalonyl-CoA synthetase
VAYSSVQEGKSVHSIITLAIPILKVVLILTPKEPKEMHGEVNAEKKELRFLTSSHLNCAASTLPSKPEQLLVIKSTFAMQPLLERYGMTEIGMALSNPYKGTREAGTVGQPLPGVSVQIVPLSEQAEASDPQLEEPTSSIAMHSRKRRPRSRVALSDGEGDLDSEMSRTLGGDNAVLGGNAGELRVKGPSVFKEYWNRPHATAEAFDSEGYFCTGADPSPLHSRALQSSAHIFEWLSSFSLLLLRCLTH